MEKLRTATVIRKEKIGKTIVLQVDALLSENTGVEWSLYNLGLTIQEINEASNILLCDNRDMIKFLKIKRKNVFLEINHILGIKG